MGRDIMKQSDLRKVARGWSGENDLQRELQVREMVDPSPRSHETVCPEPRIPVFHIPIYQMKQGSPQPGYLESPVVNELPPTKKSDGMFPPEYIQEPSLKNKRGSRRTSIRHDSYSQDHPSTPTPATATATATTSISVSQTLTSYALLRTKLQNELSSIPTSIRGDAKPTAEQRKILHHHMSKLEDILDEVDSVPTPTADFDDMDSARKARREVVADIVGAIDGIERFIAPETPDEKAPATEDVTDGASETEGDSDALFDEEIQKVIRETLARKKDEELASTAGKSRRSVTVEEVPDLEY